MSERTSPRLSRALARIDRPLAAATPVIAVAAGFVVIAGLRGAILAACLLVSWLVLPAPFPFAVGQAAVPVVASFATPFALVGLETALLALLALDTSGDTVSNALGTLTVLGALALLAVGFTAADWSFAATTLALCLLVAVCSYLLHRYGRVRLGLVTD